MERVWSSEKYITTKVFNSGQRGHRAESRNTRCYAVWAFARQGWQIVLELRSSENTKGTRFANVKIEYNPRKKKLRWLNVLSCCYTSLVEAERRRKALWKYCNLSVPCLSDSLSSNHFVLFVIKKINNILILKCYCLSLSSLKCNRISTAYPGTSSKRHWSPRKQPSRRGLIYTLTASLQKGKTPSQRVSWTWN